MTDCVRLRRGSGQDVGVSTHTPGTAPVSSMQPLDRGRTCLLVTGAPGAGKSTITRMVAAGLTRSALLDGYVVSNLVVSGRVWALGEPADEAARQVTLCNENLCALATNLANAGFTPVIDTVIPDVGQLDVFRRALGERLRVIVLDPGTDVCKSRNATARPSTSSSSTGTASLTQPCAPDSVISAGGSTRRP